MCGIGGILRVYPPGSAPPTHEESIPEAWLDVLDESIKHRGPDGQGRFRDRATRPNGSIVDAALVHRRLSIIDHAGGAQPMVSLSNAPSPRDGDGLALRLPAAPAEGKSCPGTTGDVDTTFRAMTLPVLFHGSPSDSVSYRALPASPNLLAVAFNGCIYNHRELREELQAAGDHFVTDRSDTEVLLHGWRRWRRFAAWHFDAMEAWLLWDRASAELIACRGQTGEKPLYFAGDRLSSGMGSWVFCSAAYAAADIRRRLFPEYATRDPRRVRRVIAAGFGPPWAGVESLAPSRDLCVAPNFDGGSPSHPILAHGLGDLSPDHHHQSPAWGRDQAASPEEAVETALADSVRDRLDADVPIACLLSGGVDSSLIAFLASRERGHLRTICVRMPHARYDESEFALVAARSIGSTHQTLDVHAEPAVDLVRLIQTIGTPFGDSSLLPTYWAFAAAAPLAKVVLTGDGGDELFLGYERYQAARSLRALARARPIARLIAAALGHSAASADPKSRASKLARLAASALGAGYDDLVRVFPSRMLAALLSETACEGGLQYLPRSAMDAADHDLASNFPDGLLAKVDHASLAAHVEARAPFLSNRVRMVARSLPEDVLMPRGRRKGLLRDVARKYLPAEIVDRPKMGFAVPIGDWFRSDFGGMKTLLLDMLHSADPFPADLLGLELNRTFIRQMLDEHMEMNRDHSQRLYMLLVLAIWCRWQRHAGGDTAHAPHGP